MSTSLANAPYASCSFLLTVVPNFRRSAGTSWLAALRTLINLRGVLVGIEKGGGREILRSRKTFVLLGEHGDCQPVHSSSASSSNTMHVIFNGKGKGYLGTD